MSPKGPPKGATFLGKTGLGALFGTPGGHCFAIGDHCGAIAARGDLYSTKNAMFRLTLHK